MNLEFSWTLYTLQYTIRILSDIRGERFKPCGKTSRRTGGQPNRLTYEQTDIWFDGQKDYMGQADRRLYGQLNRRANKQINGQASGQIKL